MSEKKEKKVEVSPEEPEEPTKFDKIKKFGKKYWLPITVGVVCTTVTYVVTRRVTLRYLPLEGTSTFIHKAVLRDGASLYKVFNIYSTGFKNQGPSWMVKCVETGKLFASQEAAAKAMGLSKGHMSMYLNGARHNVGGYTFQRIGIAA